MGNLSRHLANDTLQHNVVEELSWNGLAQLGLTCRGAAPALHRALDLKFRDKTLAPIVTNLQRFLLRKCKFKIQKKLARLALQSVYDVENYEGELLTLSQKSMTPPYSPSETPDDGYPSQMDAARVMAEDEEVYCELYKERYGPRMAVHVPRLMLHFRLRLHPDRFDALPPSSFDMVIEYEVTFEDEGLEVDDRIPWSIVKERCFVGDGGRVLRGEWSFAHQYLAPSLIDTLLNRHLTELLNEIWV